MEAQALSRILHNAWTAIRAHDLESARSWARMIDHSQYRTRQQTYAVRPTLNQIDVMVQGLSKGDE